MTHPQYSAVDVLVCDPVASNRNATRAVLRSLGFQRAEFVGTTAEAITLLSERAFDLLLLEVGGAEAEMCALIQSIRQGKIGGDPFLVTIITTWRRDSTIVGQAINSGADDLIARPFAATSLGERLRQHIDRRKGFVVTSDYIGPDRRRDMSRAGSEPIPVPNALKWKSSPELSPEEAEQRVSRDVEQGKRTINAEKLRRDSQQLFAQWRLLDQRRAQGRDLAPGLKKLDELAADIVGRAQSLNDTPVSDCCILLRAGIASVSGAETTVGENPAVTGALRSIGQAVQTLADTIDQSDGVQGRVTHVEGLAQADARTSRARSDAHTGANHLPRAGAA